MWKKFSEEKPREDGAYLVFMSEFNDLGKSQWMCICNWNAQMDEPEFQDFHGMNSGLDKGAQITHWMPLPDRPDTGQSGSRITGMTKSRLTMEENAERIIKMIEDAHERAGNSDLMFKNNGGLSHPPFSDN